LENYWELNSADKTPAARFIRLIRHVHEKTGKRVVVLIDEYDKPLINTMDNLKMHTSIQKSLKGFYGVLKGMDTYLHFVMLTGVTKFSKVSVFSDLNHLEDISLDKSYAAICGITESELLTNFEPELHALAHETGMTYEEALAEMEKRYDGYHFSQNSDGVYNPFSVLNTLKKSRFDYYWFETGTPTVLIEMFRQEDMDIRHFEKDISIPATEIADYRVGESNPISLFYQSGYLTIKAYDAQLAMYTLGFPNDEVEYGFLSQLLPTYLLKSAKLSEFYAARFVKDLQDGNVDGFMTRLRAFFASISYDLNNKTERDFQTTFFLVFKLMGQFVNAELRTSAGRIDAVVITADTVYVFEFKLDTNANAEAALKQIDDKDYTIPFTAGNRKIVKVGVEFDAEKRTLSRWVIEN
jgi:hypothetical protein